MKPPGFIQESISSCSAGVVAKYATYTPAHPRTRSTSKFEPQMRVRGVRVDDTLLSWHAGSGRERGHGVELTGCPRCYAALRSGTHHTTCIRSPEGPPAFNPVSRLGFYPCTCSCEGTP